MPTVTLSDPAFGELKSLAEPFVDTPESLIAALIHAEVERRGILLNGNGRPGITNDETLRLNPDAHENLRFARPISATVEGQPLHRPKWSSLRVHLHILGHRRLGSFDALRGASGANLRQGRYEMDGYKYVPQADLSIQGVDSNLAWDHSLGLARALGVPIKITFQWPDREGAAHPGQTGVLEWTPTES